MQHVHRPPSDWHPIKEYPPAPGLYFVSAPSADTKKPLIALAYWADNSWQALVPEWIKALTHWMPLPHPPKY